MSRKMDEVPTIVNCERDDPLERLDEAASHGRFDRGLSLVIEVSVQRANFDVILLDQGKTFMFDNDRFGPDVDYYETYRSLGGHALSAAELHAAVTELFSHLLVVGRDPDRFNSFPTIQEAIRELRMLSVPPEDRSRLDELFALHELGTISADHAATLHTLARAYRLGVVSNIWASPARFVANLEQAGVRDCFEHLVWSSEHGCLKPSPRLFEQALDCFRVRPERVLFVGDHPVRDIDAAKSLGLSAVWIRAGTAIYPSQLRAPDGSIDDLAALPGWLSG